MENNVVTLFGGKSKSNFTKTENGALAYASSGNYNVDLFFNIGTIRSDDKRKEFLDLFSRAVDEDYELAIKILLWSRDARGGAGCREPLRFFMSKIVTNDNIALNKEICQKIVELGYWKDFFDLYSYPNITKNQKESVLNITCTIIAYYMKNPSEIKETDYGLFCKWFPRKAKLFFDVAEKLGIGFRSLRKHIVANTTVVETKMCANEWEEINFSSVPSIANKKYVNAFLNRCKDRYTQYLEDVKNGKTKMNTDVLSPFDITLSLMKEGELYSYETFIIDDDKRNAFNIMWNSLDTSYMKNKQVRMLCISDVSGSMFTDNLFPISGSLGLGTFIAQNTEGPFKNKLVSFSSKPNVYDIEGKDLVDIFNAMSTDWEYNTDISKVYDLILNTSLLNKDNMPTHIIIFSDMQFDQAQRDEVPFKLYEEKFRKAGLEMPKIIFWNLNTNFTYPARIDDNVLLLSGYNPNIVKEILTNGDFDALNFVKNAVNKDKYKLSL